MAEKYTGEMKPGKNNVVEKPEKGRHFEVTFLQNRRFELALGRKTYIFETGRNRAILTEDQVQHPDFKQQLAYFSVREI